MLTRIRHQVVRPWIRRPRGLAFAIALFAAFSSSSAFAQCRGAGAMGGSGSTGGATGTVGASLAGLGTTSVPFTATGLGQSGHGFFAVPTEQMMQPAFPAIVDDNRQYVAERRAVRSAKVEQARQRLASRKEKPARHRAVAVNLARE